MTNKATAGDADTPHESSDDRIALILPAPPAEAAEIAVEPSLSTKKSKHSKRLILAGVVAVVVVVAGLSGLYLRGHSLVAVQVAGMPATRSVDSPQLQTQLTTAIKAYRLSVKSPDGKTASYPLSAVGITPDVAATARSARGQHGVAFWHVASLPLVFKTNKAALTTFIAEHTVQATTPAQDATLSIVAGKASTTPEKAGQGYSIPQAPQVIQHTVAQLNRSPLPLTPGPIQPLISQHSLQSKQKELTAILAQKISFSIAGNAQQASASDIGNWLDLNPVPAAGTVDITANSGKIAAYIDSLTQQFTTASSETLSNIQPDGSLTIVINSGAARTVTNEKDIVTTVASKLLRGQDQTADVALSDGPAAKTISGHSYDKWLLVNVSSKRMYAYQGTTLIKSFLVTAGAPATPTVLGTYKIYAKYASQNMQGENADGSRYFQPNVQYVNYFYKDYAVHGNYWRPTSYFGNVNSSHGCVGIVNADAAWIYDWAPIGTTVMVHA